MRIGRIRFNEQTIYRTTFDTTRIIVNNHIPTKTVLVESNATITDIYQITNPLHCAKDMIPFLKAMKSNFIAIQLNKNACMVVGVPPTSWNRISSTMKALDKHFSIYVKKEGIGIMELMSIIPSKTIQEQCKQMEEFMKGLRYEHHNI